MRREMWVTEYSIDRYPFYTQTACVQVWSFHLMGLNGKSSDYIIYCLARKSLEQWVAEVSSSLFTTITNLAGREHVKESDAVGIFCGHSHSTQIETWRFIINYKCLVVGQACPISLFIFISPVSIQLHFSLVLSSILLSVFSTSLLPLCGWLAHEVSLLSPFFFIEPKFLLLINLPNCKFCLYLLPCY